MLAWENFKDSGCWWIFNFFILLCFFVQGVWSFLLPPNLPMCHNSEKKTESWTGHPLKWLSPELATPELTRVEGSAIFWGDKSWTLPFFGGGKSWTLSFQRVSSPGLCFFSGFGKFRGGKKDQTPCMYRVFFLTGAPINFLSTNPYTIWHLEKFWASLHEILYLENLWWHQLKNHPLR